MLRYGLIGGTGLSELPGLRVTAEHDFGTPYGILEHPISEGSLFEIQKKLFFLPRHGRPHRIPPHKINYRANLFALRQLGVSTIIAVNAVGSISPGLAPGRLVIPDQIVDYTWGRQHTLYDGADDLDGLPLNHIDMSWPYDQSLREGLVNSARAMELDIIETATYAATQGPRLETAAEIKKLAGDGCDVVGMTGMPEAALAREMGLAYASLCVVVNFAAGLSDEQITMEMIEKNLARGIESIKALLVNFLQA
tara:strand:- start:457 stop:1212 length:756 start_codon:yes stop_codon:yes gene_type:complete